MIWTAAPIQLGRNCDTDREAVSFQYGPNDAESNLDSSPNEPNPKFEHLRPSALPADPARRLLHIRLLQ